ncbi:HAMP domain-containing histidine kinase [Cnuibacter physcomitrellae]|uniref:sensor histidine kinase n=1 Tax=Cnuibacter physcomitrellae TaxID=1619308 RepID=UPI002175DDB0|nr:HAMP domain-containing sensor histidine kinase [Cnuibacter physcomitrellae]MCS5499335.1 HAMP domain-containing histidine kinase [Cnuibacter physcomitrellae]
MHNALLKQWNSISLRTKITGVTVLMLTFGLVVSGIGTMLVLRSYLLTQVDSQLDTAARDPSAFLGPGAQPGEFKLQDIQSAPDDYFVGLYDASGNLLISNWGANDTDAMPSAAVSLDSTNLLEGKVFTTESLDQRTEWHAVSTIVYIGTDGSQGSIVIAQALTATERTTATYLSIFLAFGIGVVILGAMLTRLLVTSTFGPLRAVERTAAAIADGDFSQRLSDDIPNTEVGRLNRSLNTMLSRIDRAFADRARTIDQMRRFVGDASHELRTPLVSVRGYAELYRMGALQTPEDVASAMERIEKEAIRMSTLVEDLLELARLDETRPLQLSRVDLVPLAMDAAMDARASSPHRVISVITPLGPSEVAITPVLPALDAAPAPAPAPGSSSESSTVAPESAPAPTGVASAKPPRGVSTATRPIAALGARLRRRGRTAPVPIPGIAQSADETAPIPAASLTRPIVLAEENKIRQVIANLVGNALRYTPDDSPIDIAVSADDTRRVAVLDVIDHGEGIPPQIREKIFQRFWRADTSRARETGGSGLGLAIVASIVATHQGTVEALETPGGGATFRVTLPLVPVPGSPAPTPRDAAASPSTDRDDEVGPSSTTSAYLS